MGSLRIRASMRHAGEVDKVSCLKGKMMATQSWIEGQEQLIMDCNVAVNCVLSAFLAESAYIEKPGHCYPENRDHYGMLHANAAVLRNRLNTLLEVMKPEFGEQGNRQDE